MKIQVAAWWETVWVFLLLRMWGFVFFYPEEKIQRDPERDSDFHFSVHRPTMRGVFPVSVTCYLTDAAAGICCSRVGQLEEDGRRRTAERRCATCWSSASHDSSALWPVNRRVAAGAFTQSVHIHFVSPVHTHTHTHTMTRTQWHKPTHPHTSWVCSSLEVLISYCWAAVKSVSSSVCTIIFEPIPVLFIKNGQYDMLEDYTSIKLLLRFKESTTTVNTRLHFCPSSRTFTARVTGGRHSGRSQARSDPARAFSHSFHLAGGSGSSKSEPAASERVLSASNQAAADTDTFNHITHTVNGSLFQQ